jgi:DNA ligase-1
MAINVMLAKKYEPNKHRVLGWYMSEKLDGVRAVWNGHAFVTRNGNELKAPWRLVGPMKKLTEHLGANMLDGELYMGRGAFNECSGTVRRHDDEWIGIEYHVFDIVGPQEIFFKRHRLLEDLQRKFPKFVRLVEQKSVITIADIMQQHNIYANLGGEGLMLKNPSSLYQFKRSGDLLKVKAFEECEAMCIGWLSGEGKYLSMMGAIECELPNGMRFNCGSGFTDGDRHHGQSFVGKTITVKYFELSEYGVPRFPIYKGIRADA